MVNTWCWIQPEYFSILLGGGWGVFLLSFFPASVVAFCCCCFVFLQEGGGGGGVLQFRILQRCTSLLHTQPWSLSHHPGGITKCGQASSLKSGWLWENPQCYKDTSHTHELLAAAIGITGCTPKKDLKKEFEDRYTYSKPSQMQLLQWLAEWKVGTWSDSAMPTQMPSHKSQMRFSLHSVYQTPTQADRLESYTEWWYTVRERHFNSITNLYQSR